MMTIRKLWNFLPGPRLRRIVQTMMNEEPAWVNIDNKLLTNKTAALAGPAAEPANAEVQMAKQDVAAMSPLKRRKCAAACSSDWFPTSPTSPMPPMPPLRHHFTELPTNIVPCVDLTNVDDSESCIIIY